MTLPREDFARVLALTPLVSIDLVVHDEDHRVLVGLRTNKPARGAWFVPGGRIFKNERLDAAFARISLDELGRGYSRAQARPLGVFEHLYDDNALDLPGVGTHYVVIGYALDVRRADLALPDAQHATYRWLAIDELLADHDVHENTRAYFAR